MLCEKFMLDEKFETLNLENKSTYRAQNLRKLIAQDGQTVQRINLLAPEFGI